MNEFITRSKSRIPSIPSWARKPQNLIIGVAALLAIITSAFLFSDRGAVKGIEDKPTIKIGKSYEIIARTQKKEKTTGRFTLTVTNAQFADSIIVQGKRARPVKGKQFLVVNMEITNPHKIALYAFPVDLFRFIREDGQKFAPSVHQGTVLVRPEATKKNNVAFVILPEDKKFKIEVGDINEAKETLEINF